MMELELSYDAFLRAIKQNAEVDHVLLLGAGASISSGVQSASDCIWEWKRDIFVTKNHQLATQYKEYKADAVRDSIQKWLDNEGVYPVRDDAKEYSFYAKLAYPIEDVRRKYFENICRNKEPYIGYKILSLLAKKGFVRAVFTTNFDGLAIKAAHQSGVTPIEITLDSADRIYRPYTRTELLSIALHGDYKYGPLKNTDKELDAQQDDFVKALVHHLNDKHLVVFGYSGRDTSLMDALKKAYQNRGSGMLLWCGFGHDIGDDVRSLIETARASGREAFYIPTEGFDPTLIHIARTCFDSDSQFQTAVEEILKSSQSENFTRSPFSMEVRQTSSLIRSNLFPVSFPKEVFQFETEYGEDEEPWKTVRSFTKGTNVVAGPIKKMIYAFGTLDDVHSAFGDRIKSEVRRTPISRGDLRGPTTIKKLCQDAIFNALSKRLNLHGAGFEKLWRDEDKRLIKAGGTVYEVFEAARISFFRDSRYDYLALQPSFFIENRSELSEDIKREVARLFYKQLLAPPGRPQLNANYNAFIEKWRTILFREGKLSFDYPIGSGTGFKFSISPNTMYSSITRAQSSARLTLPQQFDKRQILHNGIQYLEPELQFIDKNAGNIVKDFHPMRGLIRNRPYDYPLNGNVFEAEVNIGIVCPPEFGHRVSAFLNRLNQPTNAGTSNPDYLMDYPGFLAAYDVPLNIPHFQSGFWQRCILPANVADEKQTALSILSTVKLAIDKLVATKKRVVIVVFIPTAWNNFTLINTEQEKFDLHDHIKAYAAQNGIATQFIREDTLTDPMVCQVNWWLSLSFYVKSLRTPWILAGLENSAAFVGLGYSVNHRNRNEKVVLGCSHIYNASGQGLKYKLSQVEDCTYDKKNNPFLSYQEAYKFGVMIREMFLSTTGDLPKRVVVHKRTPFKKDEVRGIVDSLKKSGIEEIDLIEINYEDDARFVAMSVKDGNVEPHGFPLSRGTCMLLDSSSALLWTHGIVPSIKGGYRSYFLGGRSIPAPLKITKHYGNSNISTVATEILGLTKMNWNSFDLYTKLPATIMTSNEIARIGWLLNRFEGKTYDYRNFM